MEQCTQTTTPNALQSKLIPMMEWFHGFCTEHNIRYYAVGGTVLGAVRHQGFIPWDDDIDVGVPRADYNRLIALTKNLPNDCPFRIEAPLEQDDYIYPFCKLYDTSTTLIENMRKPFKRGIYIDVFPLDGVGNNEAECQKTYKKIRKNMSLLHAKVYALHKDDGFAKRAFYFVVRTFRFLIGGHKRSLKKIVDTCEKKPFDEYTFSGNMVGAWKTKEIMQREWFGTPTLAKFETMEIFIPENHDAYLTHLYGDYMQLPPEEKRKSHHDYLFLDLNKSYLED